jgi:Amino acid permease
MVYAELGAAMPGAGGAYIYFRQAFNPRTWGILLSFLFLWETIFVAPLAISAACVGFAEYTHYFLPRLSHFGVGGLAAAACVLMAFLLYRPIKTVGRMSVVMLGVVLSAMFWVIGSGLIHMNTKMAFDFPPGAFHASKPFFFGLAAATLIAMYNYRGYNNITYLGGEVKSPAKNIPRAIVGDSSPLRHVAVSSSRPGGACRVDLRRNHARAAPVSRHRCCPLVVGIGGVLASGASGQVVAICPPRAAPRPRPESCVKTAAAARVDFFSNLRDSVVTFSGGNRNLAR